MTALERLLTAFRRGQPDRVPIIVRGVNPYTQHMNWRGPADPSYGPLLDYVREHCEIEHIWHAGRGFFLNAAELPLSVRQEQRDGWRITCSHLETPKGPLTAVSREGLDHYSHGTLKHWICDAEDVERFLSLPFVPAEPDLADYCATRTLLGDRGYVLPNIDDPIGQVHALIGSELLGLWTIEAPGLVERLLDVMSERCTAYVDRLVRSGISPVLGLQGQESVVPPLLAPRHFPHYVTRYNIPLIRMAHAQGCLVSIHCHGRLRAVLEQFVEMGADILHPLEAPPMGDITLAEAKQRVGHSICLQGNIQIGDVMLCSRAEIVRLTRVALEEGMPRGGFVLTLTATPFERVLAPRTLDNLLAMVETALIEGRYR